MQEHNVKEIRDLIIYTKTIPAHPASFAEFPTALHPDICDYLTSHNIPRLYTHQAEMFAKAQAGENVVITTYCQREDTELSASGAPGCSGGSAHPGGLCLSDKGACRGSVPGTAAVS